MQIVECPYCFATVVPKADGLCPACQNDIHQHDPAKNDRSLIRVSPGDILPPVCCGCGCTTDRYVKVRAKTSRRTDDGFSPSEVVWLILLGWFFLILRFFTRRIEATEIVQVEMPQCPSCGKRGRPSPDYVDFDRVRISFVVHKNLKQEMACGESLGGQE
jgi:hypothetical protein